MRKRTDAKMVAVEPLRVETFRGAPNYQSVGTTTIGPSSVRAEWWQFDDTVTPGYRQCRQRGDIVMNSCSMRRITDSTGLMFNFTRGPYPSWYSGGREVYTGDVSSQLGALTPNDLDPHPAFANLGQIALTAAYAKVNAASVLSGEILGDMSQTLGMLRPFRSATDLLAEIARRKSFYLKKRTMTHVKAASKSWLEMRYGWRPLIGDAETIIDSVHTRASVAKRFVARSGTSMSVSSSTPITGAICGGIAATGSSVCVRTCRANAGIIYEVNTSGPRSVAQTFGTRAQDLPATLWEVVPYSFVVDWFTNCGNWIQAVTPRTDVSIRGSWITTVDVADRTTNVIATSDWSGVKNSSGVPSYSRKTLLYTRSANPAVASTPVVRPNGIGSLQIVDALGLIVQNIKSGLGSVKH